MSDAPATPPAPPVLSDVSIFLVQETWTARFFVKQPLAIAPLVFEMPVAQLKLAMAHIIDAEARIELAMRHRLGGSIVKPNSAGGAG